MKIMITGNMGYIGPSVVKRLSASYPGSELVGVDLGFFANCLTNADILPECNISVQHFMDVRLLPERLLEGVDAIIHLAAISNDPMGNKFEDVTFEINFGGTVALARKAKAAGVRTFVFASSCSMYGSGGDGVKSEDSALNPLTAYAKSKVMSERELEKLADGDFRVTSLRFSTACGMSERLRLDLVLNDFVASAVATKEITILSDGTPWRPLIHIRDMARAMDWAVQRGMGAAGQNFMAVNIGSNEWNYQVKDLAKAVAQVMPDVDISINPDAQPDKRSYRVSFDLFRKAAPDHQPRWSLIDTVRELKAGLEAMNFRGFRGEDFRNSRFMRLRVLSGLRERGYLSERLVFGARRAESSVLRREIGDVPSVPVR